jgi:hypothetical protein
MTELQNWLKLATRHLSKDSAAQVRREIQEHYELTRESGIGNGESESEASRLALVALGDPNAANREYCKVLLTSAEARALREVRWEAQVVCARPWMTGLLLGLPLIALIAAATFFVIGNTVLARDLLVAGIGMGILFLAPFLPIYTPLRGRVFRGVKWIVLIGLLGFAFGSEWLRWSWLLASSLWPMLWIEWTRISLRRKLPVEQWPKQLYL